jgi:hypothetical protein
MQSNSHSNRAQSHRLPSTMVKEPVPSSTSKDKRRAAACFIIFGTSSPVTQYSPHFSDPPGHIALYGHRWVGTMYTHSIISSSGTLVDTSLTR